jgi:hypothetical protein
MIRSSPEITSIRFGPMPDFRVGFNGSGEKTETSVRPESRCRLS